MANHKSALKRARQNAKLRVYNRVYRNRTRTLVKQARETIDNGENLEAAIVATRAAVRDLDKAASRGIIHKRNASRRKSRLMKQLAKLQGTSKSS